MIGYDHYIGNTTLVKASSLTDSSVDCVRKRCASVYCIQRRQDSSSDCTFYLILTRQPLASEHQWAGPMSRFALEGVFMQMFVLS